MPPPVFEPAETGVTATLAVRRSPQQPGKPSLTLTGLRSAALMELLVLVGIVGWILSGVDFAGHQAADWMAFYTGVKVYLQNHLDVLFNGVEFTALQNANFSRWLDPPLVFQPWVYPPSFLVLLLPFGLLPFWISYAAFMALSFCGLVIAVWALLARHSQKQHMYLMYSGLMLCPAMAYDVFLGQNGLLTCALLLGAFAALPASPVFAGVLLGLLSFKPQLWLMIPVALLARRHLKALAAAVASAGALAIVSLALFGLQCWTSWLEFASGHDALYRTWTIENRVHGQSVFASAAAFGASPHLASAMQGAAILLSAISVWWAFRRPMGSDVRLMILLVATVFASPHLLPYDMLPLGFAAVMLFVRADANNLLPCGKPIAFVIWLSPALGLFSSTGEFIPPLLVLFIGYLLVAGNLETRAAAVLV